MYTADDCDSCSVTLKSISGLYSVADDGDSCSVTLEGISELYSVADDGDSCSVTLEGIGGLHTTAAHCGGEPLTHNKQECESDKHIIFVCSYAVTRT